jgi:hypothetical protein
MTDAPELLPCPFCGGSILRKTWRVLEWFPPLTCVKCGATAKTFAAWNTRADLPATDAQAMANPEVQALVEVVERLGAHIAIVVPQKARPMSGLAVLMDQVSNALADPWQPIATVPKGNPDDLRGPELLLWCGSMDLPIAGQWAASDEGGEWLAVEDGVEIPDVTHWQYIVGPKENAA